MAVMKQERCLTLGLLISLSARWHVIALVAWWVSGSWLIAMQIGGPTSVYALSVLVAHCTFLMVSSGCRARQLFAAVWAVVAVLLACVFYSILFVGPWLALGFGVLLIPLVAALRLTRLRKSWPTTLFQIWIVFSSIADLFFSIALYVAGAAVLSKRDGSISPAWLMLWRWACVNLGLAAAQLWGVFSALVTLKRLRTSDDTSSVSPLAAHCCMGPRATLTCGAVPLLLLLSWSLVCTMSYASLVWWPVGDTLTPSMKPPPCLGDWCAPTFPVEDVLNETFVFSTPSSEEPLHMDVYRTMRTAQLSPCIVLVHGGGFRRESRRSAQQLKDALHFARIGFVVASVDYRLEGTSFLPSMDAVRDAVLDVQEAVRFLTAANFLGIDPSRIAVKGTSAGGIIAASLSLVPPEANHPLTKKNQPVKVAAVVSSSGCAWPFLVTPGLRSKTLALPPWLDVHGAADATVFPFLPRCTKFFFRAQGLPEQQNRLYMVPGQKHIPWNGWWELQQPYVQAFLVQMLRLQPEDPLANAVAV